MIINIDVNHENRKFSGVGMDEKHNAENSKIKYTVGIDKISENDHPK